MADYVSIISRAVAALAENNAENREAVYAKARATIDRKLRAIEPMPSEALIKAQLDQLEAAIHQVENEQSAGEAAAEAEAEAESARSQSGSASAQAAQEPAQSQPAAPAEIVIPPANPPEGFIDNVLLIDGIGEKTAALLESEGVTGISQIYDMDEASLAALTEKIGIPNFENTQEWKAQARAMLSGKLPRSRTDRDRLEKFKAEMQSQQPAVEPQPEIKAPVPEEPKAPIAPSAPERRAEEPQAQWHEPSSSREQATRDVESWLPPASGEIAAQAPDPFHDHVDDGFYREDRRGPASVTDIEGEDPFRDQGFHPELRRRRRGGTGRLLKWILLLAILGGAGYGAYVYRDQITEIAGNALDAGRELAGVDQKPADQTAPQAGTSGEEASGGNGADDAASDASKDPNRLGGGNVRTVTEDPIQLTPSQPAPEATGAGEQTETASDAGSGSSGGDNTSVEVADGGSSSESGDGNAAQTGSDGGASLQPEQPVVVAGERAFLYEEGAGTSSASRDEGNIVWQLVQEPPEPGTPAEAVIRGVMEIPGRGLVMNLTIKRNVDAALPASHIIELLFKAPPEFSGGNIDEIFRFVMKSTEESRGESLVGVPAKIDTGYFLIALNNLPQAQEANINLLQNANWVDIPVQYLTGRRGLITLEKGPSGAQIFQQAFDDWQNR